MIITLKQEITYNVFKPISDTPSSLHYTRQQTFKNDKLQSTEWVISKVIDDEVFVLESWKVSDLDKQTLENEYQQSLIIEFNESTK